MGTHTPTPPSTAPAYARIAVRAAALAVLATGAGPDAQEPVWREISGVYPHLAMFNSGQECGTGGGAADLRRRLALNGQGIAQPQPGDR